MLVDAFDFDLPSESIALRPAEPRDTSRMLVVHPGGTEPLQDSSVRDLPGFLRPGDVIVVNDTRVIPGRLTGHRTRGEVSARIEATLHKREGADRWLAFVRPAKKLEIGEMVRFARDGTWLDATVLGKHESGEILFGFSLAGAALDTAVASVGSMPLPPYVAARRRQDAADLDSYQTMFAREPGAVAAPTAGLHFTPALMAAIAERGIELHCLTLHVGAGTFLPVKAHDTAGHHMHAEWGTIDGATAEALNVARTRGGRLVAVGTTSLRLLESAADPDGTICPFTGETAIFITPGYRFRAVDVLMTNFHLPRSTLFMLVAAFSGLSSMRDAYAHAIRAGYRFYSYGDACLLFPEVTR